MQQHSTSHLLMSQQKLWCFHCQEDATPLKLPPTHVSEERVFKTKLTTSNLNKINSIICLGVIETFWRIASQILIGLSFLNFYDHPTSTHVSSEIVMLSLPRRCHNTQAHTYSCFRRNSFENQTHHLQFEQINSIICLGVVETFWRIASQILIGLSFLNFYDHPRAILDIHPLVIHWFTLFPKRWQTSCFYRAEARQGYWPSDYLAPPHLEAQF